jgi:molecular chaperone DnaK (HSP70)
MAASNTSLGRFRLEGIHRAARVRVEVTFDIDANAS